MPKDCIDSYIVSIISAFIVGVISSWLVALYFFRLGKHQAARLHVQSQLDLVRMALARCDPTQRDRGRRGDDGLESTEHWMLCMAAVIRNSGSEARADSETAAGVVEKIGKNMGALRENFAQTTEDEQKRRKKDWDDAIQGIAGVSKNVSKRGP